MITTRFHKLNRFLHPSISSFKTNLIMCIFNSTIFIALLFFVNVTCSLLKSDASVEPSFPRRVTQCHHRHDIVPKKVERNFQKYANGWERVVYNDTMISAFLSEHFVPAVGKVFAGLQEGAHKADLFRYAMMYIHGGVYFDIKTELIAPLDYLFRDNTSVFLVNSLATPGSVYNGILGGPSRQQIFLDMVTFMVEQGNDFKDIYHYNIRHLYTLISSCNLTPQQKCTPIDKCVIDNTTIRFGTEEYRDLSECYGGRD